mmetsp:Transcript_44082/g.172011  ORF Transcript_44082/g.172011 Transcript_44082/m.172011 type:complete len:216 (+) Transcript_44082:360-1007(+)
MHVRGSWQFWPQFRSVARRRCTFGTLWPGRSASLFFDSRAPFHGLRPTRVISRRRSKPRVRLIQARRLFRERLEDDGPSQQFVYRRRPRRFLPDVQFRQWLQIFPQRRHLPVLLFPAGRPLLGLSVSPHLLRSTRAASFPIPSMIRAATWQPAEARLPPPAVYRAAVERSPDYSRPPHSTRPVAPPSSENSHTFQYPHTFARHEPRGTRRPGTRS